MGMCQQLHWLACSQMLVQWTTNNSSSPEVKWGSQPGIYPYSAAASSLTYTEAELCGPPANAQGWLDPGTFHKAVMTDLQAGQRYYYIYGDEVSCYASAGLTCPIFLLFLHLFDVVNGFLLAARTLRSQRRTNSKLADETCSCGQLRSLVCCPGVRAPPASSCLCHPGQGSGLNSLADSMSRQT